MATIVELRRESKKPEDIKADDLSDILDTISENNIEKYVQEQELFKIQTQKQKEENENLKKELSKVNIKYQQKEQTVELQNIKLKEYEQRILIIENDKIKDTFFKKRKEYQIKEIAAMAGYSSDTSFRRAFKRVMGVSPGEYSQ